MSAMSSPPRSLAGLLDGYRPQGEAEAADVARVRVLARTAADPWLRSLPLHVTASALIVHPGSGRMLLRWLSPDAAREATSEANLRDLLSRVQRLLAE